MILFHKGKELRRLPELDDQGVVIEARKQLSRESIIKHFHLHDFKLSKFNNHAKKIESKKKK